MVLLLSWDAGENIRDRVSAALITSTIRGLDAEVELSRSDGVPHRCVVNLDDIAPILYTVIHPGGRVCRLSEAKLLEVSRAIHLALGMRLPCPLRKGGGLL
jgi:mRNA-degrading endonuclease toxin of MazEF toxin-antitoxin module